MILKIREILVWISDNKMFKYLNMMLLVVFIFNIIFLPNDTYNMKIISLFLLLFLNFWNTPLKDKVDKLVFLFGFIVPVFSIFLSICLTGDFIDNIRLGYPAVILLLYLVIKKYNIDFEKILYCFLGILAYVEAIVFILQISGILPLSVNPIVHWLGITSNALWGEGIHATFGYIFYIKSAGMLFIYEAYCMEQKKYFSLIVTCVALFATGTRANVFLMMALLFISLIIVQKNNKARITILVVAAAFALYLIFAAGMLSYIEAIFNKKSHDDSVRMGHLIGLKEYWGNNILRLIIGSGYTSEFFTYGTNMMVRDIEWSYLNLLRQVGIFPFICMMAMYFYPIIYIMRYKTKSSRYLCLMFGYIMYLTISIFDPFLYNSTAITLVLFMYWICFGSTKENVLDNISQIEGK